MRCILLAGGPPSDYDQVRLETRQDDYIIACDAGYRAARHFGVRPDLVVGDFDSLQERIAPEIPVLTVPARKNDTDTSLGVKKGLERGCRDFLIVGGFGGRLDHTLANMQMLGYLCEHGARGEIRANENRAWAIRDGEIEIPPLSHHHISVFAWGGVCKGVDLQNMAYPLSNYTLEPTFPLGVSNEFLDGPACIRVKSGTLLIIASQELPAAPASISSVKDGETV